MEQEQKTSYQWKCTTCGYVYDGDPLPPHFICPVCGSPAPKFERIEKEGSE